MSNPGNAQKSGFCTRDIKGNSQLLYRYSSTYFFTCWNSWRKQKQQVPPVAQFWEDVQGERIGSHFILNETNILWSHQSLSLISTAFFLFFFSNSWQEEALRDEQLAQEEIAVILANLTAKRTAMVSVLFLQYTKLLKFSFSYFLISSLYRCLKPRKSLRKHFCKKRIEYRKSCPWYSQSQLMQRKSWMDMLRRWETVTWRKHFYQLKAERQWKIVYWSGK